MTVVPVGGDGPRGSLLLQRSPTESEHTDMQLRRSTRAAAAFVLAASVLAAMQPAAQAAGGHPTAVISARGRITMPHLLTPGVVHISVRGSAGESLELLAPRHGGAAARLVSDYRVFAATGLPGKTEHDFRYIGGALVGKDFYTELTPGTYLAIDGSLSTLTAADVVTIRVRGVGRPSTQPAISGTIAAIGSNTWSAFPTAIERRGYLYFVNASTGTHFVSLLQLKPGTTLAAVRAVLAEADPDPSTVATGVYFNTGVLSPGGQELSSYTLPAGSYAVLDLWPDDHTGRSHSSMGMVRLLTLR